MKRELGIARCGLACCLCSQNPHCRGCGSGDCPETELAPKGSIMVIAMNAMKNVIKAGFI